MARMTIQVQRFYAVAKSIGLKRGQFRARSPKDANGEYQQLEVTIFERLSETQTRKLAESYNVTVFRLKGETSWHWPLIRDYGRSGLVIDDLDDLDEYGLPRQTRIM